MTSMKAIGSEIRAHAGSIDDCVKVINTAQGASKHVKLGNAAYGKLCQFLPPILSDKHDGIDKLLTRGKQILKEDAVALRKLADEYETTDLTNASDVEKTAGDLPDVKWG